MELSQSGDESKVLVIYTGGTIGMLVGQQGYVPEPLFLTKTLRSQKRFHDPLQESLYSHSGSVEGFREWSQSGKSTPLTGSPNPNYRPSTLPVRSSRPIGPAAGLVPGVQPVTLEQPECTMVSKDVYEAHLPSLVTPCSAVGGASGAKRIRYAILEWNPLLDSSNTEIHDWIRIATDIELNYFFDAFVVLHGTDTMAYTSSALSFLLEDLGKTVILTGAQIPLSQLRNDAVDNLLGALTIAGHYIIPECSLYFNHTLFRGNRVSKLSSYDFGAFDSPNFPPLVDVGIDIVVNWKDVIRQTGLRRFRAHKAMSPHVATLRLFPGITAATIKAFMMPPTRGVVLETFGAGNAPQRTDLMGSLKEACERGVVIVAISQCTKGSVSDAYETGRTLQRAGVVPGGDMTPECALTKLSYLLSKPELSPADVRRLMGIPLRGELTRSSAAAPSQPTIDQNVEKIQGLLSQFVRMSSATAQTPNITITASDPTDEAAQDAAKPWSWTAAEAVSTEAALIPFLVHLAAAKDDVEGLKHCLYISNSGSYGESTPSAPIAGGIANCLDPGSGRSPLHVAALNGSINCTGMLLESGGLVHLRDSLGHTALYYAARQGHVKVVEALRKAGANLGGVDLDGRFATLAFENASRLGDPGLLSAWDMAGIKIPIRQNNQNDQVI